MKVRITALILSVFFIAAGFAGCGKTDAGDKHVQDLNYEESTEKISNPDQGFTVHYTSKSTNTERRTIKA